MTRYHAQLDLHNLQTQLEQTPSDLITQPLFNDSPVLFGESTDYVHAHASEQIEKTEQITSSKIHIPRDNSLKHHLHRKNDTKS